MDGYYYGFDETGVAAVDFILSAVASAGKAYHHTEAWMGEETPDWGAHSGGTCAAWIQNAAKIAADVTRFKDQCILDLAAGRHARGCGCEKSWKPGGATFRTLANACLHIAACARDFVGYDIDVEVGDASDTKPESL